MCWQRKPGADPGSCTVCAKVGVQGRSWDRALPGTLALYYNAFARTVAELFGQFYSMELSSSLSNSQPSKLASEELDVN